MRIGRTLARIGLLVALCLAVAAPVAAKTVALVVGNDAYRNVPRLMKAVADARAMGETLTRLGFAVTVAEDLDRTAMSRALVDFDARIEPGDTALFFYAGHGFALDGENYLLPTDVPRAGPDDAELVRDASFAVSRIVERLQKRGASTAVLVLDACRDNPFARPGRRSLAGSRGLARIDPPQGVFVLFSAGSGQAALDRLSNADPDRNSVFTRVLLKSISAPGRSMVRVAKETQVAVRALAAEVGHEQTPAYYDQIVGDLVLVPAAEGAMAPAGDAATEVALLPRPADPVATGDALSRASLLYEEARAAEARGDALGARRAYLAFAEADLDVVDPYLRFAALLRVQEGRAGAREVFGALRERLTSPAVTLVHALQFDGDERRRRLDAILAARPGYGPALYQAALDFTEDRLGTAPTLADRKRQRDLLAAFLEEEAAGTLTRHFLDQTLLGEWLDDARRRTAALDSELGAAGRGPTATFMRFNGGWSMTIQTPEPATAILWRDPSTGEMTETGTLAMADPGTGQPMANPSVTLPADQPPGPIEVAYRDRSGAENGPFPIAFDPDAQLFAGQKQIMESLYTNWVEMRDWDGKLLMYTTMLVSYGCAVAEAHYGLDGAEPTQPIALPPCDKANPGAIPEDFQPYLTLPGDTASVAVRITWYDGTRSKVATFKVAK